jgi:hypothetical protein
MSDPSTHSRSRVPKRQRRKLRSVTFSSRRARALWATIGLAALTGGYALAAPTFRSTPNPPEPWGLWVGANSQPPAPREGPRWLLELAIDAHNGCGGPVTATGSLSWAEWGNHRPIQDPTRLALGAAGVQILRVEVRDPKSKTWRIVTFALKEDTYIAEDTLTHGLPEGEEAEFRLTFLGSRSAGYKACYLTSPALFDFPAHEEIELDARLTGERYLDERHRLNGILGDPLTDAIVRMSVLNQQPDRAVLDSGAQIQHGEAVLTCTSISPETPQIYRSDPFYANRMLFGESSCASIQTFRSSDASDSLNRRVFFAGILISAAVGILLEVFLTAKLDTDDTEDRRTARVAR